MAVIARFYTGAGKVAFSESAMKIQIGYDEPVMLQVSDVESVRVRRPTEETDGFLLVNTFDGRRFRLLYDDDQYSDAIRFKRSFDALVMDDDGIDVPMVQEHQQKHVPVGPPAPKKKQMPKKLRNTCLVIIALSIAFIVWVSSLDGNDSDPEETAAIEQTQQAQETATETASVESIVNIIKANLEEAFGSDHSSVTYDDTSITVNIWQDGAALDVELAKQTGSQELLQSWEEMKGNFEYMSNSICTLAANSGRDDILIFVNLLNDSNHDLTVLSSMNGVIYYDYLGDTNTST